jgi:hypothetical protein
MADEIHANYDSGNVLYAIIRDRAGHAWRPAAQGFEDWGTDSHTAVDYAVALADRSGSRYVGDFDGNVPPGDYTVQVFLQTGATPDDNDILVGGRDIVWSGVGELTAVKLLANKATHDKIAGTFNYYDDDGQTVLLTHVRTEDAATCARTPQG